MKKIPRVAALLFSVVVILAFTGIQEKTTGGRRPLETEPGIGAETQDESAKVGALSASRTDSTEENEIASSPESEADGELEVHFLDVGQADCILVVCEGQHMLIDAGNNDDSERITAYFDKLGITDFDYVIGTHPHEDHIGSLDTVLQNYDVNCLIMPVKAHTTKTFEDVVEAIEQKNLTVTKPVVGDKYTLGGAEFTILSPVRDDYGDELNNWSVGIRLVYGESAIVMCGDAETDAETDICQSTKELSAQVLKLGHHGSSTSTSQEFLEAVNPEYAIISCGKDNSYGHPHRETLDKLEKADIKVFRTDRQGTIVLHSDGKNITFQLEKDED